MAETETIDYTFILRQMTESENYGSDTSYKMQEMRYC